MKLYIADMRNISLEQLKSMVSGKRLEKSLAFRFEMDQRRSLCAEALLNYALSVNCPEIPRPVKLWEDEWHKPHLFLPEGMEGTEFNLSHSGNYAVCLLSGRPAGVDIEQKKEMPQYKMLARRYFTEMEAGRIKDSECFLRYWTLKESYVKAIGKGLSFPLNEVEVHLKDKNAEFCGVQGSYTGRVYEEIQGYVVSVCKGEEDVFPERLEKIILPVPI